MRTWWIGKMARGIIFAIIALAILSFVVMFLWNAVIPDLFRGPSLTFWQSAGLLLLSHILLRGWGPWRHGNGWRRERWRRRFEEKLASMTPEEREKFRADWRHRCGPPHDFVDEKKPGV